MTDLLEREPAELGPAGEPPRRTRPGGRVSRVLDRLVAMPVEGWVSFATVAAVVVYTVVQLHPDLLIANTTPAGGDMGAHVWGPAFLRDELLPRLRLSGWAMDWYAGFPAYTFYMVIPALAVVLLDVVLPYGVALKFISVLGVVTMPVSAFVMAKLAGLRFPVPALFAAAAGLFLFDPTFTIYGGNIASTLAGEFSFSIALSIALVYLGVLARGFATGRHRALAAALLALTGLCHLIVAFFVVVATLCMFLAYAVKLRPWHVAVLAGCGLGLGVLLHVLPFAVDVALFGLIAVVVCYRADPDRFRYLVTFAPVAGLLAAFWILPFWWRRSYMTDMGYERLLTFADLIFPQSFRVDLLLFALAVVGVVGSVVRRRSFGVFLGITAVVYGLWVRFQPQGHLWNARLTPFLYLTRYFLVALGLAELAVLASRWLGRGDPRVERATRLALPVAVVLLCAGIVGMQLRNLPFGRVVVRTVTDAQGVQQTQWVYRWGPFEAAKAGFVSGWARWNYSGYERKAAYGEYYGIVQTMKQLGQSRGCGIAQWEYVSTQDRYGTPMALMLLPFWTDGCIGSMEGLYFEASATTPYHFLTSSAVSEKPSRPVRGLTYDNLDLTKGVPYMQILGNRYYLAFSRPAIAQAGVDPNLTLVATSGPWRVYEVTGSEVVQPLTARPAVVAGVAGDRKAWLEIATRWFQDPSGYSVMLAESGPGDWQRITPEQLAAGERPERLPLDPVTVSGVERGVDRVSFRVDRPGVPVLVKVSAFPNWQVRGASGPYRVAPNLMVVIPTRTDVELTYGRTPVELFGWVLTLVGAGLVVVLARRPPLELAERPPRRRRQPVRSLADGGPEPFPLWSDGEDDADEAGATGTVSAAP